MIKFVIFLTLAHYISLSLSIQRICKLFVGIDEPLYKHYNSNISALTKLVEDHLEGVNAIYADNVTDLFSDQLSELRFKVERIQVIFGSCDSFTSENCTENRAQYLAMFDQHDLSQYCLGYMFTYLDFHNGTSGLSTVGGACRASQNSGFITLLNYQQDRTLNQSILTLAHELAHSFGAKHDDGSEMEDRDCVSDHLMTSSESESMTAKFSNCSLEDMRRRVEEIIADPAHSCLAEDDEEPLLVSVCGNSVLEAGEDCDCGRDQFSCDDPCCYPAYISQEEREANSTAKPCSWAGRPRCLTPPGLMYGVYIPVLFIFILTILVTVFLRHDWTRDKSLFKHVTEGNIRIVTQGSRTWSARNKEAASQVEQSRFK